MKKFYMNHVIGGGPPVQIIESLEHARNRQLHLAKVTGQPVVLLEAISVATPVTPEVEREITISPMES